MNFEINGMGYSELKLTILCRFHSIQIPILFHWLLFLWILSGNSLSWRLTVASTFWRFPWRIWTSETILSWITAFPFLIHILGIDGWICVFGIGFVVVAIDIFHTLSWLLTTQDFSHTWSSVYNEENQLVWRNACKPFSQLFMLSQVVLARQ